MPNILTVTSSILGEASISNRLVRHTVDELRRTEPASNVVTRDLGSDPLPHLTGDAAAALRAEPATRRQRAARELSDGLVAELKAADTLVIGAPMYNFGIPTTLKAWFDHVVRAGVTFRYTEAGAEGLLPGKRAIVILTRGGFYSDGPAKAFDSQEPHLRALLNFIGIEDVTFIRVEKLAISQEEQAQAIDTAVEKINRLLQIGQSRAA